MLCMIAMYMYQYCGPQCSTTSVMQGHVWGEPELTYAHSHVGFRVLVTCQLCVLPRVKVKCEKMAKRKLEEFDVGK